MTNGSPATVEDERRRIPSRWAFMGGFSITTKDGDPYLDRLRIVQTPVFGIYLHRVHGPDGQRHPHDHPWWFASVVISGGYVEQVWDDPSALGDWRERERPRWSVRMLRRS